ncbi:hypothetical protein F503_01962 [Ophiostoma piceae UAMH 11346]|uniref:Uncharacterized protein n=1 Tax=Ophiostoma piceae (strain UAMH 11346) TaxID=1262450 RepID=S3BPM6_OPHP1|nr:hypothetical protein F503_01962 [Ophiostoma piceae UAMH 11346]
MRAQPLPIAAWLALGALVAVSPVTASPASAEPGVEAAVAKPSARMLQAPVLARPPGEAQRRPAWADLPPDEMFKHVRMRGELARAAADLCPANYYSCESQGSQFDNICCPFDAACSLGSDNKPACCPAAAVCTGDAPATYVTATVVASYVPNAYYSFPYLVPSNVAAATALANADACSAVVQECSSIYSLCTSSLEAATTATYASATAASICSSLKGAACGGLPTNSAGCSSVFASSTRSATSTGFSNSGGPPGLHLSMGMVLAVATTVGAFLAGAGMM